MARTTSVRSHFLSTGKLTQDRAIALHDLAGRRHLLLELRIVWGEPESVRRLSEEDGIARCHVQLREDLAWQNDAHGVAHSGHLESCHTYVITRPTPGCQYAFPELRRFDFAQPARRDVEDETAHHVAMQEVRVGLDARRAGADVGVEILEGVQGIGHRGTGLR